MKIFLINIYKFMIKTSNIMKKTSKAQNFYTKNNL